jgi:YgiT-type zinc finger domain-containing protein
MICHNCGGSLDNLITNLPFKLSDECIAIIKGLPVLQCRNCSEYVIEDEVLEKVDIILNKIDTTAELEVLSYAGSKKLDRFGM